MVNRFAYWMEHHINGVGFHFRELKEEDDCLLLCYESVTENFEAETGEPLAVAEDDEIRQWSEFLRHCGGFRVIKECESGDGDN